MIYNIVMGTNGQWTSTQAPIVIVYRGLSRSFNTSLSGVNYFRKNMDYVYYYQTIFLFSYLYSTRNCNSIVAYQTKTL